MNICTHQRVMQNVSKTQFGNISHNSNGKWSTHIRPLRSNIQYGYFPLQDHSLELLHNIELPLTTLWVQCVFYGMVGNKRSTSNKPVIARLNREMSGILQGMVVSLAAEMVSGDGTYLYTHTLFGSLYQHGADTTAKYCTAKRRKVWRKAFWHPTGERGSERLPALAPMTSTTF
jgi:hypothetical protein